MSNIEWTDVTWNPTRGCTRVSEGCRHCYAEGVAARFSGPGLAYEGLAERKIKVLQDGTERLEPRWTGKTRFVEEQLDAPLRWRKPRRVFVNSMSDLFHKGFTDEEIAAVFAVMALAHQHTFQVLTKRPERMARLLASSAFYDIVLDEAHIQRDKRRELSGIPISNPALYPLRNVHIGVSVENQQAADERIPLLMQTPAALRFLSVEPLLEPIDLTDIVRGRGTDAEEHTSAFADPDDESPLGVDWVIVGGESGNGVRRCDLMWIRSVIAQCAAAGVACFVKQVGTEPTSSCDGSPMHDLVSIKNKKGGDMAEWPADLRVREFPKGGAA